MTNTPTSTGTPGDRSPRTESGLPPASAGSATSDRAAPPTTSAEEKVAKKGTKKGAKKGGGAGGFISGFAPWIVYWILSGATSFTAAITVALCFAVVTNVVTVVHSKSLKSLKILEVGNAIAFALLAVIGLAAGDEWVARWIQPLGNGALFLIMLVSVLVKRPFTLEYAKEATTPDLWDTPGFKAVNNLLTWVWVAAMGAMTLFALVPPIVQGDATAKDGGSALSIAFYWVIPYSFLGLAILLTVKYPDWFGAEFDDPPAVTGKTQAPLSTSLASDRDRVGDLVLSAGPEHAPFDAAVSLSVTGAEPGVPVSIEATNVDLAGNLWRASASFTADSSGAVDTAKVAPDRGDYAGVDPTGFVWSMRFSTPGATPDIYIPPVGASAVAIEATVGTTTLTKTLVRLGGAPDLVVREVHDTGVVGRLIVPAGDGPFPGVVLLGGSEGGYDAELSNASLLATHGYAALTLGYFGVEGLPKDLVQIPLERLAAGITWLAGHDQVDGSRIGAMAISRGSEGLLSTVSRIPGLPVRAVVAISPAEVSWTAMGDDGTLVGTPSWTLGGAPVPHLGMADKVLMDQAIRGAFRDRGHHPHPMHLTRAYAAALHDRAAVDAAAIPVEDIAAPLLLLSGSDDQVWPSGPMADAILRRRGSAPGGGHDHHEHYDGGGHLLRLGLLPTDVSSTGGVALGGTREGIAAAQRDATTRVVSFLDTHLA